MDGCMDGWIWMDGRTDKWMDKLVGGWGSRSVCRHMDGPHCKTFLLKQYNNVIAFYLTYPFLLK